MVKTVTHGVQISLNSNKIPAVKSFRLFSFPDSVCIHGLCEYDPDGVKMTVQ